MGDSYKSGQKYAEHLGKYLDWKSAVDLGCGRGTWLKALMEFSKSNEGNWVGIDGPWNSQANMVSDKISYYPRDLDAPIDPPLGKFDIAISLEVAEHLKPASAPKFITSLVSMSDVVVFGAAIPHQGGLNHINEKRQSYWAGLFKSHGYEVFDIFRPAFWGDEEIPSWYRQNTFIYVKRESDSYKQITSKGVVSMKETDFMDCVHPELLDVWVNRVSFTYIIRQGLKRIAYKLFGRKLTSRIYSSVKSEK